MRELHGAEFDAQRLGDLLIRATFHLPHHQRNPELLGKGCDGVVDRLPVGNHRADPPQRRLDVRHVPRIVP